MDSHVLRKASWRLPALADVAVLRFNTRGTTQRRGHQRGRVRRLRGRGARPRGGRRGGAAPRAARVWLLGWSFGTDVVLRHGLVPGVVGRGPALAAAAALHRRRPRPLGRRRPSADGPGPRARRLPPAGRGARALRPGPPGRRRRRRRGQAPLGGGALRAPGARRGRRAAWSVLAHAAAHDVAGFLHDALRPLKEELRDHRPCRQDSDRDRGVPRDRRAIALAYAQAGADVALVARDADGSRRSRPGSAPQVGRRSSSRATSPTRRPSTRSWRRPSKGWGTSTSWSTTRGATTSRPRSWACG